MIFDPFTTPYPPKKHVNSAFADKSFKLTDFVWVTLRGLLLAVCKIILSLVFLIKVLFIKKDKACILRVNDKTNISATLICAKEKKSIA